jgi:hypothetical protein
MTILFKGSSKAAPTAMTWNRWIRKTTMLVGFSLLCMYEAGSIRKLTVDPFASLNEIHQQTARTTTTDASVHSANSHQLNSNWARRTTAHNINNSTTTTVQPHYQLEPKDRLITLVHIGKAGGLTVRAATSLMCRLSLKKYNTPEKVDLCIQRFLPRGNFLDRAVQYYFHMFAVNETQLAASTSFLVTLRNPVSRIVSNFRYSHPVNCNQPHWLHKAVAVRPWGCEVLGHLENLRSTDYRLYRQCFPSSGFEDMAQSVLSPWPVTTHFVEANLTLEQQHNCRWIALQYIQGKWSTRPGPHMHYNYEYYRNWTLLAYPEKEFLAVRTTHEWQDMKALDIAMGGNGNFRRDGRKESHGSELFEPSPLSTEAYQKLCCVLEREIEMYQDLVHHMINLNATEKEECMDDVKQKCGITEEWGVWRRKCQEHLKRDEVELQRSQITGNNQFVRQMREALAALGDDDEK